MDPKDWVPSHFRAGSRHEIARRYYAGGYPIG